MRQNGMVRSIPWSFFCSCSLLLQAAKCGGRKAQKGTNSRGCLFFLSCFKRIGYSKKKNRSLPLIPFSFSSSSCPVSPLFFCIIKDQTPSLLRKMTDLPKEQPHKSLFRKRSTLAERIEELSKKSEEDRLEFFYGYLQLA